LNDLEPPKIGVLVNLFSAATDITFLITRRRHSAPQTRSFYLYQLIKQRFKTLKHYIKNKKKIN